MPGRQRIAILTLLVVVAAFGVYLVGNGSVALWDRDEPRYAQASRQMVRSGDWVVPRFLDELRTKKPPLIYWCQAAAMEVLGDNEFAARLPSSIAVTLVLILLAVVLRRFIGRWRAMWTVLVLATSLNVVLAAKVCLTDAVLLLWVTIGQLCLYAAYRGRASWPVVLAFWLAAGLGALTKGTNLAVHAATLLALAALDVGPNWRSLRAWGAAIAWWKGLKPLVGGVVFAAVVTPWLVTVHRREPAFLPAMFGNVGKHVATSAEGHAAPPGYYLLTVWGFFLPWSLLLPMALVRGWRRRKLPPVRFALAATIGPWLFVECMLSKLPHYLLPAYPAMAFLTADAVVLSLRSKKAELHKPDFLRGVLVWAIFVIALGVVPWLAVTALHECAATGDRPPDDRRPRVRGQRLRSLPPGPGADGAGVDGGWHDGALRDRLRDLSATGRLSPHVGPGGRGIEGARRGRAGAGQHARLQGAEPCVLPRRDDSREQQHGDHQQAAGCLAGLARCDAQGVGEPEHRGVGAGQAPNRRHGRRT